jgi:hypothetical protein
MKPFSLASLALLATLAPATAQNSILPYLPQGTIVAVAMPDLAASLGDFSQMPLAKMWAEPEVQAFFADVRELIAKKFDEGLQQAKDAHARGEMPIDPQLLLKLRVDAGTFALTKLGMEMGDRGPQPEVGMILHLEFGDSATAWRNVIQLGLGLMEAEAGDEMTKQESKVGDVTLLTYSPPAEVGTKMSLNVALTPTGLVVGTIASEVRDTLAAMQAKTPSLGGTPAYQAAAKRLSPAGAECEVFLRPAPMIDFGIDALRIGAEMGALGAIDMDGVERAVAAMGLRDLGAIGMTCSYVDGKCITRSFVTPGDTKTPGGTSAVQALDTSFLRWVPKDAVSFNAGTMNVMSVYETLVRGLEAYDAEFAKHAMAQLTKLEQQLGFNVRDDFFGAFGDHYITWSMPMGTISSPPEMAVLVKVTDEQKLVKVMKNLAKLTNGIVEIEEGEKRGVKAYELSVNFDPTQGMGGMNVFDMIRPTFAFKDGYMVAGFSASDVKRVFQRMDRKDDDPKNDIRGNKEFAAVAATIPTGVDSVAFTDWKSNFESLYQVATGLLAFVPMGDEVPINMSLLPDSATLTKHLFASVSYTKSDATGTEMVAISPFGPEVVLVVVGAMAAAGVMFAGMQGGF